VRRGVSGERMRSLASPAAVDSLTGPGPPPGTAAGSACRRRCHGQLAWLQG